MNAERDDFYNLAERIENAFSEIDSDICARLRDCDISYTEIWREVLSFI